MGSVLQRTQSAGPPITYDVRNLTPDGKRIEESQQSVERKRKRERDEEGDAIAKESKSSRRGWSAAIEKSSSVSSWRDHLVPRRWSHHHQGATPTSILKIPWWYERRERETFLFCVELDVRYRKSNVYVINEIIPKMIDQRWLKKKKTKVCAK